MCNLGEGIYEEGLEKGIEKGIEEGIEKGIEEGIEEGIEKGIEKRDIQIIQKLLEKGKTIEEISDLIDVDIDKVKEIEETMLVNA